MKFKVIFFAILFALVGCTGDTDLNSYSYKEYTYSSKPPELADCKTFRLNDRYSPALIVTRCPNSSTSTSYQSGKFMHTSVVIDGNEYTLVPKAKKP